MADKKQDKFSGGKNNSNNRRKDPKPEIGDKRFIDDPNVSTERKKEILKNATRTDGVGSVAWAKENKLPPYDKD
jgi:hypothetical protein